ncbi:MAG: hypothetical protein M9887_04920 [Chitinophagales bacterium]|nr:hypothetical protein [Chitinophagales bacterium]
MSEIRQDPTAEERKNDHISLAFQSYTSQIDERFSYEPLLGHSDMTLPKFQFLGKELHTPIWIGSMTGGTEKARMINGNLARACCEFKMGMGLGSCRQLLFNEERWTDFDWRETIGAEQPFYANLGIAQIEELIRLGQVDKVEELIKKLKADGLFIHINPLQEWLQPEGDKIHQMPLETIQQFLELSKIPVIVKEVGQGMGKESLRQLMKLPIQAIEFSAHGGTNFSKLELLRSSKSKKELYKQLAWIGHSADEMVNSVNEILDEEGHRVQCNTFIISGGIKSFLDGYHGMQKINANAIYGQASTLLKYAQISYQDLKTYIESQIEGLKLAYAYLKIK